MAADAPAHPYPTTTTSDSASHDVTSAAGRGAMGAIDSQFVTGRLVIARDGRPNRPGAMGGHVPLLGTGRTRRGDEHLGCAAVLLDLFRMEGKAAIVTGASRGIGAASALALAECGCDLVVSARSAEVLSEFAEKTRAATGRQVEAVPADLNDLDNLARLADVARERFGRVDVVINNVGGTMPRPLLDTSPRYLEAAFHWNVTTAFALTKACVPLMLEGGGGAVINISSAVGHLADRGYVGYGTAKAALDHLTELMATDLAPRIRVNAVAPGSIETDALGSVLNDEMRTTMINLTPLRRLGRVEDIAAAIVYLASDAGSFLTGKVLEVDGGLGQPNLPLGLPDL